MTEDATLDQFASAGSDADADADADDEPTGGRDDAAEPAVSTYRFAPDGRACADCGGSVTRLWRDGDALVCPDCKQWQE